MSKTVAAWKLSKIVDVEWIDSCMSSGWHDRSGYGLQKASRCRSVGFLLSESKTHLQLALSQDADCDNINGAITIPKVAILKRRAVR